MSSPAPSSNAASANDPALHAPASCDPSAIGSSNEPTHADSDADSHEEATRLGASDPTVHDQALRHARREVRLKEAQWHQKRAEVARLIAAGEEAAADRLLGLSSTDDEKSVTSNSSSNRSLSSTSSLAKPKSIPLRKQPQAETNRLRAKLSEKKQEHAKHKKSDLPSAQTARVNNPSKNSTKPVKRKSAPGSTKVTPVSATSKKMVAKKAGAKKVTSQLRAKSRRTTHRRLVHRMSLWMSKRPAWAVSLTLHLAMLVVLMLATFATLQEDAFVLTASLNDGEEWAEEIPEISLVSWEVETDALEIETELETLVEEPILEKVNLSVEDSLDSVALNSLPATSSLLTEVAGGSDSSEKNGKANNASATVGQSQSSSGSTSPTGKVSFFGVRERADRVVFVVDNSGSMQRGRMETTLNELNRAVQSLSPHQSYYVIFYSDQAYPMFFPQSVEELQPATRDSKRQFAKWLRTIEICLGGRLLDAIEMAASLDPQVVFLMSDGDIRSQRVMQSLTQADAWPFTIHSFGMEVRTKKHAENLSAISQANEGEFRVVDVRPKAIRQSMVRPIPYHRKPGEVWGSKVQVW